MVDRFAELYQFEVGRFPDKRIYIVNGQIELLPDQRDKPLAASPEDLQVFSEVSGLVVWTIDLFRALTFADVSQLPSIKRAIKCSVGLLDFTSALRES